MYFVSDLCFIHVVLKVQMKLISVILTTSYHAAFSDPSRGLELNIAPVISPVKTLVSRWDNFLEQQACYSCCFQQNWFLSAKQQQPLSNSLSFAHIHVDPNQNMLNDHVKIYFICVYQCPKVEKVVFLPLWRTWNLTLMFQVDLISDVARLNLQY